LNERGEISWDISIDEDRHPDSNGAEHHRPPHILLPPEHCVEMVGAPEGSDSVAYEINIDGRAYDAEEDDGVKPGQLMFKERYPTGEQEGVCEEYLRPECGFDTAWGMENEDR
jgi:hypothetical protein